MKNRTAVLAGVLALVALAGCATGEAGKATSPVDARLTIEWPAIAVGDTMPTVTVTATQTVTITPTSAATQTPTNTTSTTATVPTSVIP